MITMDYFPDSGRIYSRGLEAGKYFFELYFGNKKALRYFEWVKENFRPGNRIERMFF